MGWRCIVKGSPRVLRSPTPDARGGPRGGTTLNSLLGTPKVGGGVEISIIRGRDCNRSALKQTSLRVNIDRDWEVAMRRIISTILGVVLLGGGVYVLYMQLFQSPVIKGLWLFGGGAMACIGAFIILEDLGLIRDRDT